MSNSIKALKSVSLGVIAGLIAIFAHSVFKEESTRPNNWREPRAVPSIELIGAECSCQPQLRLHYVITEDMIYLFCTGSPASHESGGTEL